MQSRTSMSSSIRELALFQGRQRRAILLQAAKQADYLRNTLLVTGSFNPLPFAPSLGRKEHVKGCRPHR